MRSQKSVLLFGGLPVHRLKPVGVMRRSALDSPLFHGRSDYLRNRGVELSALVDRAVQRLVDVLRRRVCITLSENTF